MRDWVTTVSNSLGHTITTGYDAARRPTSTTDTLSRVTETTFDANGQPTQIKDPLNRTTQFSWNARGEKTRTTNALTHYVNSTLDGNGNQTILRNRRAKNFSFAFDDANRATSITTPTNKVTATTYWNNNRVKTITEPSAQQTTLAYNGKNLVSSKTDPTGTITYGYDDSGLLETVTEGSAVITRTYDERGRLKSFTTADGDVIQYKYDASNNLARVTYPPDTAHPAGKQVNYTYNARNLLASVTDWNNRITTYSYDRLGRLTGTTRPNGTSNQITQDAAGQITSIRETSGTTLISYLRLDHDAAGQISRRFRAPLVNSGWQHPSFAATHDDDNRLASVNGATVTHDADGNMIYGPIRIDSGNVNLTYNSRNQLTNADSISYTYDAEGRRRTITDTNGTTRDVIDPNFAMSRLLVRHHPDGSKTYYVYGLGLLYEVDEAETTKTYHFDQVGSTIARTDDTGKVIGKAEYSAYGICFWKHGDMATPFLYNGQTGVQTDSNGLLQMRARYYTPYLMRFLNADPIGFSGGSNWHAYADGNPISLVDPLGFDALFLYGFDFGDPNYFRDHSQAQALAFERASSNSTTLFSGEVAVTIYGPPSERAHVLPARNTEEFNRALTSVENISSVVFNGHSMDLGVKRVDLDALNTTNLTPDATILLNGCWTGYDNNGAGTYSAQRFADHFGVPVRGVTEGLSFGLPLQNPFANNYIDLQPGRLRAEGSIRSPNFMWANPKNKSK